MCERSGRNSHSPGKAGGNAAAPLCFSPLPGRSPSFQYPRSANKTPEQAQSFLYYPTFCLACIFPCCLALLLPHRPRANMPGQHSTAQYYSTAQHGGGTSDAARHTEQVIILYTATGAAYGVDSNRRAHPPDPWGTPSAKIPPCITEYTFLDALPCFWWGTQASPPCLPLTYTFIEATLRTRPQVAQVQST